MILSLFLGFWLCDTFMDYYTAGFLKVLDSMVMDASSLSMMNSPWQAIGTFLGAASPVVTLFVIFSIGVFGIFTLVFGLCQQLPNAVLGWLNVNQGDLGASNGMQVLQQRLQMQAGLGAYGGMSLNKINFGKK